MLFTGLKGESKEPTPLTMLELEELKALISRLNQIYQVVSHVIFHFILLKRTI